VEIQILFEDTDTLVIYKPVGLVVNRADSVKEETVQDWIETKIANEPGKWNADDKTFKMRSGVCHRLDKETSGCLVIAKNPKALYYYLKLFKDRKIKKVYTALVHGRVEPKEGEVILPLRRSMFEREKFQVHYEGKRAVTAWEVVKRFHYVDTPHWKNSLSLLSLNLKTGRTHQIRVHLSFLGWPIFSDDKYLNKEQAKKDREKLSHHFLHAGHIEFKNTKGDLTKVDAPLPEDCTALLNSLLLE
jgi:23S rRNA pseudouridine1911/1915/1917 synthase